MKKLSYLLFFLIPFTHLVSANNSTDGIDIIEYKKLIINWSPNTDSLGSILAIPYCNECDATRYKITKSTQLFILSNPQPIEILRNKVDWTGAIGADLSKSEDALIVKIYGE
ncbi:hypothetical protein VQ643_03260 [Pseudomonas sp. F1_0610]|uniref:hypothetical protein n=1 Tax=Pseudomonas sp. F1_0610 TaxID=3114284 RepID=UPI0039C316CB